MEGLANFIWWLIVNTFLLFCFIALVLGGLWLLVIVAVEAIHDARTIGKDGQ